MYQNAIEKGVHHSVAGHKKYKRPSILLSIYDLKYSELHSLRFTKAENWICLMKVPHVEFKMLTTLRRQH
jgi:hypothetical protein